MYSILLIEMLKFLKFIVVFLLKTLRLKLKDSQKKNDDVKSQK